MENKTKYENPILNPIDKSQNEAKSIPLTHIHNRSLSYLGTDISIKSDGVKFVLGLKSHLLVSRGFDNVQFVRIALVFILSASWDHTISLYIQ